MIRIYIKNKKIEVIGHADYADYGKDIVCASASAIVTTSVNLALRLNNKSLEYKENNNKFTIYILNSDDVTKEIINNMLSLLEDLAKTYKKNVKIIKEEELWN